VAFYSQRQENPMTNRATDYSSEGTTGRMRGAADVASDRITDTTEKAQDLASGAAEQARQYGEKARDAARQFKPFVERSLKDRPVATLAGAAVIGFVLGALWKR
jgi:ElaB/YqjD/DUF883 family membrane-anchored ribosome-binding protein